MAFLVILLLLQTALAAASAVPVPVSTPTKDRRSTTTDLVDVLMDKLLASFQRSVPVATENGTLLLEELLSPLTDEPYRITRRADNSTARALELETVRASFLYTTLSSGGPYYPSGELGVAKNALDVANITTDLTPQILAATVDGKKAIADAANYDGLQTLEDYGKLYDDEWLNSMPNGTDLGMQTNYTQDLLFSMQRLSSSPYQVRRLRPGIDDLPFVLSDGITVEIADSNLGQLLREGRLFYADYRDQLDLESTGRFAAACDAYFYLDAASGDFLPLAIRTNVGADLIYTPLDSPGDWLLAKMMLNTNDFWFAQWHHLAATHYVVQIVWAAAVRTLSREHPVFAIMNRLTLEAYSIPILAQSILFTSGGAVDLVFPFTGPSANNYTNRLYDNGAGRFQGNYFEANLRSRGLIGYCQGPPIRHFPFFEDAQVIHVAIHTFMASFVRSYYSSDREISADKEIQAWAAECTGAAQAIDFPSEISSIDSLVDILTHVAHLVSSAHHAVNTNELLQVSSTLPSSPISLYSAIPTEKSNSTNVVDFLPPLEKVIEQFIVGSLFARPHFVGSNRTIIHMFDDPIMLALMNRETRAANDVFVSKMNQFSAQMQARGFDGNGLSQGMPFVWKALDPNVAPYSLVV